MEELPKNTPKRTTGPLRTSLAAYIVRVRRPCQAEIMIFCKKKTPIGLSQFPRPLPRTSREPHYLSPAAAISGRICRKDRTYKRVACLQVARPFTKSCCQAAEARR